MVTVEEVKKTLENNTNIEEKVKDAMKFLIDVFHANYENISLDNLNNNLKTLKIVKSNKFFNKRVSKYNSMTNVLEFNIDEINKGYDMKHVMMFELLNLITFNGTQVGFNSNNKFEALNAGYTEILTNNLVGNDSDVPYLEEEVISTNLVATMIGNDTLFNAYFNNDTNTLVNSLVNEGVEV